MYRFLVMVEDRTLQRVILYGDTENRRDACECFTQAGPPPEITWENIHDDPDGTGAGFAGSVKYVWCVNDEQAKKVSTILAKHQPGKRVFIASVAGAAYVPPGEVTFQTVNEKGILPS